MTQPHSTPTTRPQAPPAATAAPDADDLAAALAGIPSGLFIITWQDAGADRGMLASWVMQAGFAPPAVTVAVAPGRDLLAAIDRGQRFVINVLTESQRSLLARFGRPPTAGEDPFASLEMQRAPSGPRVITNAAAWLECHAVARVGGEETDHVVVLGTVTAAGAASREPPLVHLRTNGLRY